MTLTCMLLGQCLTWIVVVPLKWGVSPMHPARNHIQWLCHAVTHHAAHAKKGENGTPKEDPWCWCHCFCPDQVPPSICVDQVEVPKPQELPEALGVQDTVTGGQENQPERSTVTHHHSQRLLGCQWQYPGALFCEEALWNPRGRRSQLVL